MSDILSTVHGLFTSNSLTGQTAQEVYNEYLQNLNKPPIIIVSDTDRLLTNLMIENANVKKEMSEINIKLTQLQNDKGGI